MTTAMDGYSSSAPPTSATKERADFRKNHILDVVGRLATVQKTCLLNAKTSDAEVPIAKKAGVQSVAAVAAQVSALFRTAGAEVGKAVAAPTTTSTTTTTTDPTTTT
mgnify:CR=1 FL=1